MRGAFSGVPRLCFFEMNNPNPENPPSNPVAQQIGDSRRRLRELLSVPERDRTDEQWDEIIELEIQLAPGNRISPNEAAGGGHSHHASKAGGGSGGGAGAQQKKHRPRTNNNRRPRPPKAPQSGSGGGQAA